MELFGRPVHFVDRIPGLDDPSSDLELCPPSRWLDERANPEDGIIPATFVGGPIDGSWGMMEGDLDWPDEGGVYRQTAEMDDTLTIWRWEGKP